MSALVIYKFAVIITLVSPVKMTTEDGEMTTEAVVMTTEPVEMITEAIRIQFAPNFPGKIHESSASFSP